ncbi:TIGR04255 family protein [Bradyrhizobium sp. Rc2d]|uniref:TIGR04255 family protein n=1 Tax=Bradyrhizobium sp. Rc2d TaxID=1855321 RepID=UPI000880F65B|nr:TIGR04255 family protein [Bradyrhizobium sp. Rc2d]SDJ43297.1 TIGR04255 family protein [Bradyrhizobium sp. Rc2d]
MDWEPAHADHSIDSVNILFTFAEPIDGDSFDDLIIPLRRAANAHRFTNRVEGQETAADIPLVPQPGQPVMINIGNVPMTRRVAFQRLADGVVASECSIGVSSFTMWTLRYRRWANFYAELEDLCRAIDGVWPLSQSVKSIRLQYIDRFVSIPGGASHFEVLAEHNPNFLVVPQRDPMAAFHVHNGWFDYDSSPGNRILTNVNIDAGDVRPPQFAGGCRNINFLTLMQFESLSSTLPDPLAQADILHQRLKHLFRQLISSEAAARVGLPE